jgi:hypothetical protein
MAVVKANYCKRGAGERQLAKANIYYIQTRPGRDKERLTRTLFGPGGSMGRLEAYQLINEAPTGTYFYRLKLSPDPAREDTKRDLHMQKVTRSMMKRLEKRLKTTLPWAAALHDDHTTIRHVHILAAISRRLQPYELEFLIREATQVCLAQRRGLDLSADRQERRTSRLPWQQQTPRRVLKTGTYTAHRASIPAHAPHGGRPTRSTHTTCTCPRCHYPQTHNRQTDSHQCVSCGIMLHQKRALVRQQRKGRGLERAL